MTAAIALTMALWAGAAAAAPQVAACDVLTDELITEIMGTAPPDDANRSSRDGGSYTSCGVRWEAVATRDMDVGGRTMQVADNNEIRVTLTVVGAGDPAAVYESSTSYVTENNEHEAVDGVADRAVWVPGMKQLSVLAGSHVFHVNVHRPDDEGSDLDDARRLAAAVIEALGG